jgi:predicted TIM-barrel fold metal-dependent hydrolase
MPDSVLDSHLHFWQVSEHNWYPELRQMAHQLGDDALYSDFLVDDYRAAAGNLPVDRFVHVSATTKPRAYLEETRWVSALADRHGLDLVLVGTVDPSLPEAAIVQDLDRQAASPRFRGARVLSEFPPDSRAAAVVLHWLQDHGMVFDLVTGPAGMPTWLETLSGYPDLPIVLEHTGWPSATDAEARAAWLAAITSCARQTGALCKISGLGMTTLSLSEHALRPWVEQTIETFGWDRVCFGSNIPIEHMAGAYRELRGSLGAILSEASASERARFYRTNAERVYRF